MRGGADDTASGSQCPRLGERSSLQGVFGGRGLVRLRGHRLTRPGRPCPLHANRGAVRITQPSHRAVAWKRIEDGPKGVAGGAADLVDGWGGALWDGAGFCDRADAALTSRALLVTRGFNFGCGVL